MANKFTLISVIILFAIFAPVVSFYTYEEIISVTDSSSKEIVAKSLSPQIADSGSQDFSDRTFSPKLFLVSSASELSCRNAQ